MRSVVRSIAKMFPTVIIGGRSRDKVYDLVGLSELYYADSHGMDIIFSAKDMKTIYEVFTKFVEITKDIKGSKVENHKFCVYVEITKDIKGSKVENHKFCVSVHYQTGKEVNMFQIFTPSIKLVL